MGTKKSHARIVFCLFFLFCLGCKCLASEFKAAQTATIKVDASPQLARKIPDTLFGIFFEEINHAGAGGIWAELVNNRGFEAGGPHTPSNIDPWSIIGDDSSIFVATDRTSCFSRNIVALRMEVLCNDCPAGGVGIYNPGFWGMNIEDGKTYNLVMYVKSPETTDLTVSLTSSDGLQNMASATITVPGTSNWTKLEQKLVAKGTNGTSRLQITTNKQGVVWFDQVSLMPEDTYKLVVSASLPRPAATSSRTSSPTSGRTSSPTNRHGGSSAARGQDGRLELDRGVNRTAASGSTVRRRKGRRLRFFPADGDPLPQPSSPAAPSPSLRPSRRKRLPVVLGYWVVSHTQIRIQS